MATFGEAFQAFKTVVLLNKFYPKPTGKATVGFYATLTGLNFGG